MNTEVKVITDDHGQLTSVIIDGEESLVTEGAEFGGEKVLEFQPDLDTISGVELDQLPKDVCVRLDIGSRGIPNVIAMGVMPKGDGQALVENWCFFDVGYPYEDLDPKVFLKALSDCLKWSKKVFYVSRPEKKGGLHVVRCIVPAEATTVGGVIARSRLILRPTINAVKTILYL